MASDLHARLGGARSSLAFKAPCRVATTANITLSGTQTIDGVAVVAEDRVLVKNQTTGSENGIWVCKATAWERDRDFDGADDIVTGTRVYVHSGSTQSGAYVVSTADPIVIGTSSIAFVAAASADINVNALTVIPYSEMTSNLKTVVYDPATESNKSVYLQRGYIDPCNPEFGATGDGVADDTVELQAAIDYAATLVGDYLNLPTWDEFDEGFWVTIDGGGRNYKISSTLGMLTASYRGIIFQNMKLTAASGGAWSSTAPMFKTDLGARVHMRDVYFECNRVASAIWKAGWGAQNWFERIVIRHFTDYGFKLEEGSDSRGDFLDVMKWSSSDAEHTDPAERTGTGIWLLASDCKLHACLSRNCQYPIRIGDSATGTDCLTSVWTQCHAWNGVDSGATIRDLTQIRIDEGSTNHTFVASYLGNGTIDLYDHEVRFLSCKWMDTTQAPEQARIRVFATSVGQTAPNNLVIEAEAVPTQTYDGMSVTATTVSGSDIVTMSTTHVGQCAEYNSISGTGIPTGTTIIDIPSTTTVQMSANATANGTITATVKIPLVEFMDYGGNTWAAGINDDRIRYPHSISIRQRQNTRAMTQTGTVDAVEQFFKSGTGRSRISFANSDTTAPPSIGAEGDQMIFGRSTGEDWRVDDTGKMLLGPCDISPNVDFTTAIAGTFNGSALTPRWQIAGTNNNNDNAGGIYRFSANAFGTIFQWGKSRGATIGSHGAALSAGDIIASLSFVGSDSNAWQPSSRMVFQADSAASAGIVPGRITLHTADAAGTLTERVRVDSAGLVTTTGSITTGTSNSVTTGTIELGAAADTTISRSSAGVIAVEGVTVSLNSTSATHTAGTIELGHATDTTIARVAAGRISVEGQELARLPRLASTTAGEGSALIGVEDAGSYFSGTTVEAVLQYLGGVVAALDQAVVLKGTWDASAGTFPGAGVAQAGWSYIVSPTGGTVDGQTFTVGDRIIAILDNASTTTYAGNWFKADYTDLVSSVAGRTGAVTLAQADVSGLTTADSPQFTAIELGAATDTTIARVSAGEISVEGNRIFRAGGADVPVADGGTGLSSGTSGGILGFTASGTLASSGALTQYGLLVGGGAGATPGALASLGTTTQVLHGNAAGQPTWGAVSLTADVSGTLPVANGGTAGTTGQAAMANLAGVWVLAKTSVASSSLTGTTSETILATATIPAGALGANGHIRYYATGTNNNSANNKIYRVRLGGIGGTIYSTATSTTNTIWRQFQVIGNVGSASSQKAVAANLGWGPSTGSMVTSSETTGSSAIDLVFTGQLANSGDNMQSEQFMVEIVYGA